MEILPEKIAVLEKHLGSFLKRWSISLKELHIEVAPEGILETLGFLKRHDAFLFSQLIDLCVVDYLGKKPIRFEVVYHLLSLAYNTRIRVKVPLQLDQKISSSTPVFICADWWESEAYDMFGIEFTGHPGLRRILTDYGFEGFPLRKDFPLTGYVEVRYDPLQEKVISEPVKLSQAYRSFETLSPWEGISTVLQKDVASGDAHG
jgi:NADH-quinone oxidoreductase subunit C